jgi:hypothetical protein
VVSPPCRSRSIHFVTCVEALRSREDLSATSEPLPEYVNGSLSAARPAPRQKVAGPCGLRRSYTIWVFSFWAVRIVQHTIVDEHRRANANGEVQCVAWGIDFLDSPVDRDGAERVERSSHNFVRQATAR